MDGWVKIHRKITEWEWWDDHNTSRLFIYCLTQANFRDKKWRGKDIPRGSFITSREKLVIGTGLSQQQVRTSLNKLISTSEITKSATTTYTMITVNKYDEYQRDNQQTTKRATNEQPTSNQRVTTTKERKNVKNEKKVKNIYSVSIFEKNIEDISAKAKKLYPEKDVDKALDDFLGYVKAKKTGYRDFRQAFYNWVREDRFNKYSNGFTRKKQFESESSDQYEGLF